MIAPAVSAPAAAPLYRVQQAIFQGVAADGARVIFASLTDGRCALLIDDRLAAAWGSDVYGIEVGVCEYLDVTGVTAQHIAARQRALLSPRPRRRGQPSLRASAPIPRRPDRKLAPSQTQSLTQRRRRRLNAAAGINTIHRMHS
jgi:hypothetical protein